MMSVFFNRPLLQSIQRIDPDNFSLAAIGKYRGIPTWAKEEFAPRLVVADEEEMAEDLELTPTPREVDVATDGYAEWGLNWDVMELVGDYVVGIREQLNLDWWNNRIQIVPFTDQYWSCRTDRELTTEYYSAVWRGGTGEARAIKASGCNTEVGNNQANFTWRIRNDIANVKSHLDYKGKEFKPSNLRFKYVKKQMCQPTFTWRHSLCEREALLQYYRQKMYGGSGRIEGMASRKLEANTGVRYVGAKVGKNEFGCW